MFMFRPVSWLFNIRAIGPPVQLLVGPSVSRKSVLLQYVNELTGMLPPPRSLFLLVDNLYALKIYFKKEGSYRRETVSDVRPCFDLDPCLDQTSNSNRSASTGHSDNYKHMNPTNIQPFVLKISH